MVTGCLFVHRTCREFFVSLQLFSIRKLLTLSLKSSLLIIGRVDTGNNMQD
jgi:hypothetical protein